MESGGSNLKTGHEAHQKADLERVHGVPMNRQPRINRAMREVPHKKVGQTCRKKKGGNKTVREQNKT